MIKYYKLIFKYVNLIVEPNFQAFTTVTGSQSLIESTIKYDLEVQGQGPRCKIY